MDTKHFRYFRAVYELKSINKAAKKLYISPQGLSKIIGQLEAELGSLLFVRTKQGVLPTESGTYFYKYSQNIFYKLEELEYGIRQIQDREKKLMIGFSCGTLNLFSFRVFERISNTFSNFEIQWTEDYNQSIIDKLLKDELDIAFVIGHNIPDELDKIPLFSTHPQVIVYKGHPFYERATLSMEDLEGEPLITLNEKFHTYHELIQRCADCGFTPNIIAKTMESPLIYRFVEEKHGLGIDVDIHKNQYLSPALKKLTLLKSFSWNIEMIYKREKREIYPIDDLFQYFSAGSQTHADA